MILPEYLKVSAFHVNMYANINCYGVKSVAAHFPLLPICRLCFSRQYFSTKYVFCVPVLSFMCVLLVL